MKITIFKADWKLYGKAAGPIRNQKMLEYAMQETAVLLAFWDGKSRGTKNMIDLAKRKNIKASIVYY